MKNKNIYAVLLSILAIAGSCKKDSFPGAEVSPYISAFDIRDLYKGHPVTLTKSTLYGATKLTGVTVSDHRGGNIPEGYLMIQDSRRLNKLRGITLNIGADANNYLPGDSLIVDIESATLDRIDGQLQITGIHENQISKVSSGNPLPLNRVTVKQILDNPSDYESVLSVIVKGGFNPFPAKGTKLEGTKTLNDGFGNIQLTTEKTASFATTEAPVLANYYGVVTNSIKGDSLVPNFRMRSGDDLAILSSELNAPPVIITGYMTDALGGDGNYEYVQFKALKDIDFSKTPFSLVVSNNAGASTPTGVPSQGWATGGLRTYKINMNSGTAKTGEFFYVGGDSKLINGANSTSIANANWIRAYDYTKYDGEPFGTKKAGLMANSGNSFGIAVFEGTDVTAASVPVDVIAIATGGSLFNETAGYRITNNDFFDIKNPITLEDQPFFHQGTNTLAFSYNSGQGVFNILGGVFDINLGRWTTARTQTSVQLTADAQLSDIEPEISTIVVQ